MSRMLDALRADDATASWITYLDDLGPPPFAVALPDAGALPAVLRELDVPEEDFEDLVASLPSPERTPDVWWALTRATHSLVRHMGEVDGPPEFPQLPEAVARDHPFFFVSVFLATLPHVRAYHRCRGISDEVSRASLADLGRSMREHRLAQGRGGLNDAAWVMINFRGIFFHLRRLQFERSRIGRRVGAAIEAAGLPYRVGDPALSIHIPGLSGPMNPEACDASFAEAVSFFACHFPETRYEVAVCDSWLLDPQLAEYLAPESNIMRFQRRFRVVPLSQPEPDRIWILRFVFGRSDIDPKTVPQRTTLERAVAGHLRAGRHWYGGEGWLLLRDQVLVPPVGEPAS